MESTQVAQLVSHLKKGWIWFNYDDSSFPRIKWVLSSLRLLILFLVFILCFYGNCCTEQATLAYILYLPITCLTAVHPFLAFLNQKKLELLVEKMDRRIAEYTAAQLEIFNSYHTKAYKFVQLYNRCYLSIAILYFSVPFVIDVKRQLSGDPHPYVLPLPLSAYFGTNVTRGIRFYSLYSFSVWYAVQILLVQHYWISSFLIIVAWTLADMKIFKELVNKSKLQLKYDKNDLRTLIDTHNKLIRLISYSNAYLSSQGAFQNLYASINMTLGIFCSTVISDPLLISAYTFSFYFYLIANYMYSSLGELIITEGEEIFMSVINLPWHLYTPRQRNNLILVVAVSRKKFEINYHGLSPINLTSFMNIVQTAMSYFTLLQSVMAAR